MKKLVNEEEVESEDCAYSWQCKVRKKVGMSVLCITSGGKGMDTEGARISKSQGFFLMYNTARNFWFEDRRSRVDVLITVSTYYIFRVRSDST